MRRSTPARHTKKRSNPQHRRRSRASPGSFLPPRPPRSCSALPVSVEGKERGKRENTRELNPRRSLRVMEKRRVGRIDGRVLREISDGNVVDEPVRREGRFRRIRGRGRRKDEPGEHFRRPGDGAVEGDGGVSWKSGEKKGETN
jgi:hypothetical protein